MRELLEKAQRLRDKHKGRTLTYSPKVFIPLTQLCRDFCSYCTFRRSPRQADALYLEAEEVLAVARQGEQLGCREALFVLGERPEERYPEAARWLRRRGYESTIEYLYEMCRLVLRETQLFPHSNAGNLTREEMKSLREVNVSLGLMLENVSERLCGPGGPHARAPSKRPAARLETLEEAGRLRIPFTTGLLLGIGETRRERIASLQAIGELQRRYGHIQEVILQNFRAKARTSMSRAPEPTLQEMVDAIAQARLILGGRMNIQAPPNLAEPYGRSWWREYLQAGLNDWGGISPLTRDYVNPEAPWPHIADFGRRLAEEGFILRARFAVYPEFFLKSGAFLPEGLRERLLRAADPDGYVAEHSAPTFREDLQVLHRQPPVCRARAAGGGEPS